MIYNRPGGKSPHTRGLQITVVVPDATTNDPINTGDVLVFTSAGAYTAEKAADGDEIQMQAIHPVSDGNTPLGVQVYGFSRIDKFEFTGTLVIGDSIAADGNGTVKQSVDSTPDPLPNGTFVCFVDDTRKICEVLMP